MNLLTKFKLEKVKKKDRKFRFSTTLSLYFYGLEKAVNFLQFILEVLKGSKSLFENIFLFLLVKF